MKAWTDYPIEQLGDVPRQPALVREVEVLDYDGDKYCTVNVCGLRVQIKAGYLYQQRGRLGEVPVIDTAALAAAQESAAS